MGSSCSRWATIRIVQCPLLRVDQHAAERVIFGVGSIEIDPFIGTESIHSLSPLASNRGLLVGSDLVSLHVSLINLDRSLLLHRHGADSFFKPLALFLFFIANSNSNHWSRRTSFSSCSSCQHVDRHAGAIQIIGLIVGPALVLTGTGH